MQVILAAMGGGAPGTMTAECAGALAAARGRVALLHSPRAAHRFADLVDRDAVPRDTIRLATLSEKIAAAAGAGWAAVASVDRSDDDRLVALAAKLAIDP